MGSVRKKDQRKVRFQDAFEELERIVERFEQGEVDIEEGLKEFERGLALAAQLKNRLQEVENAVKKIKAQFDEDENGQ